MTLDEARRMIGRAVVYRPYGGGRPEQGLITSVNDKWVFVRFDPVATYGTACPAECLQSLHEAISARVIPEPPRRSGTAQRRQRAVDVMETLDRRNDLLGPLAEVTGIDNMIRTMREGEPPRRDDTAVTPTLAETMVWRVVPRGQPVEAMKVTATNLYAVLRWAGLHPGDGIGDSAWIGYWVIRNAGQAYLVTEAEFDDRYELTGQVGHYVDTTQDSGL